MDSIFYTIEILATFTFSFLLALIITFFILYLIFYYENKPFQQVQKILLEKDFIIFKYDWSPGKIVLNKLRNLLFLFRLTKVLKKPYFGEIQAKTLKNKSFLMVEEEVENYPNNQVVFVLRNPKDQFPSFKMTRKVWASLPKKKFNESSIYDYYSLTTNSTDLLETKFSEFKLKKYLRAMAVQVFQIEHDRRLQTTTLLADKLLIYPKSVVKFLLDLTEELEDYTESSSESQDKQKPDLEPKEGKLPHSLKIYNSVSLVNVKRLKVKCVVCWGPVDYSTETLVFECCTGYTHLNHGIDWLQNNKEKCPKCGQEKPFTIQLPSISLR